MTPYICMHAHSCTLTNNNNTYNINVSPAGKSDIHSRVESALQDVNEKFLNLESTEKTAVRTALVEERSRYCHFMSCLKPVIVSAQPCKTQQCSLQQSWTVYERHLLWLQVSIPECVHSCSLSKSWKYFIFINKHHGFVQQHFAKLLRIIFIIKKYVILLELVSCLVHTCWDQEVIDCTTSSASLIIQQVAPPVTAAIINYYIEHK